MLYGIEFMDNIMNLKIISNFAVGILFLTSIISCSTLPLVSPTVEVVSPTVEANPNMVIVTREQAEEMGVGSWLVGNNDLWTPSVDNILKLEEKLPEYLSQNSSQFFHEPPVWQRLDEYQRQYIGLERGGRHMIYGNYFCDNLGLDWQHKIVIVEDGGECFFQFEYEVESELFIKLLVNGES